MESIMAQANCIPRKLLRHVRGALGDAGHKPTADEEILHY